MLACSCFHIIHASNTSIAFPQQILPADSRAILFPIVPIADAGRSRAELLILGRAELLISRRSFLALVSPALAKPIVAFE